MLYEYFYTSTEIFLKDFQEIILETIPDLDPATSDPVVTTLAHDIRRHSFPFLIPGATYKVSVR